MKSPAPFSGMIIGSFQLIQAKAKGIAIAVLSFAMCAAVLSAFAQREIDSIEIAFSDHLGVTREQLDSMIQTQLNQMSSLDLNEFINAFQNRKDSSSPSISLPEEGKVGLFYIARVGPILLILLFLDFLIAYIAYTYFLTICARGSLSAYEVAVLLPKQVVIQSCGFFWILVKSYVWIPLVGPFIGIYLVPRMALLPVILSSGEVGIFEGIQRSFQQTSGKWWIVTTRHLAILAIILLSLWPAIFLVLSLMLFSVKLAYVLWLCILLSFIAFYAAAKTMLAVMMA